MALLLILYDPHSHPKRPTPSSWTWFRIFVQPFRSSWTIHPVILNLFQDLCPTIPFIQSRFCSYVCNWRAGMLASEVTTQHNGMPSPASKRTPGRVQPHFTALHWIAPCPLFARTNPSGSWVYVRLQKYPNWDPSTGCREAPNCARRRLNRLAIHKWSHKYFISCMCQKGRSAYNLFRNLCQTWIFRMPWSRWRVQSLP